MSGRWITRSLAMLALAGAACGTSKPGNLAINPGAAGGGVAGSTGGSTLPPTSDYAAMGPFSDAKMFPNVGPGNNYTLFRPDASLGKDGFKHAIATWGNGIDTTPDMYIGTLTLI